MLSPKLTFRLLVFFVVAAFAFTTGCAPYTQTNRHRIQQTALVPPPTGPSSTGPMESEGEVAVEGAVTASESRSTGDRADGAHGHIVLDKNLGLRILGGAQDHIEVSGGVTFANADLATATADDIKQDAFGSTTIVWFEPEIRARFVESSDVDVYAIMGARTTVLPYLRHVTTETRTRFDTDLDGSPDQTHDSSSVETEQQNKFVLLPRGGVGSYFKLSEHAGITVGGLLQGAPRFFGQEETVTHCENPTGYVGDERCSGTEPDEIDAMELALVGTAFGGVHVNIDRTRLGIQGFYNIGGDPVWKESSPFGATVTIRQTF